MQLTIASDPGIRLSKMRARLYTAVYQTNTYARATQPLVDRRETQRTVRCQQCHIFGHEASTCNVLEKELITIQASIKKRQRGCRTPLMNAGDGSSIQSPQAAHRAADAPPYFSNCPTQSSGRAMELIRQRRSTVVQRNTGSSALGQLYEESGRGRSRDVRAVNVGAWNVPSGAIHHLLPPARTADERGELCGLVDGNIRCSAIDPTAAHQDAAVYVGNELNPAGHDDSGVKKLRCDRRRNRPTP
ncbi:hypothetical protein TCSYLVIO_004634 [Trypanosoma cruzi]|nr:hypothetical protein TCSYLVIO_004634 [Trypanosoma cruzi]